MEKFEQPLAWWERSPTRRVVAISFLVGLGLGLVALFPDISNFYHQHSAFDDFIAVLTTGSGLGMAREK